MNESLLVRFALKYILKKLPPEYKNFSYKYTIIKLPKGYYVSWINSTGRIVLDYKGNWNGCAASGIILPLHNKHWIRRLKNAEYNIEEASNAVAFFRALYA